MNLWYEKTPCFPLYCRIRKGVFHICDYPLWDYSETVACMGRNPKYSEEYPHLSNTPLHEHKRSHPPWKTLSTRAFCVCSDSFHTCDFYPSLCFQHLAVSVCKAPLSLVMGQSWGCWRETCTRPAALCIPRPGAIRRAAVLSTTETSFQEELWNRHSGFPRPPATSQHRC